MSKREFLRVLHAARLVADDVNRLLDARGSRIIDPDQLRRSSGSVPSNIQEAYSRKEGPDRKKYLRYASGSADETNERLRTSFAVDRIKPPDYWRNHNRLIAIVKMLKSLIG